MPYTLAGIKRIPDDVGPIGIRCNRASPLILLSGNGAICYAKGRIDKDTIVAQYNEEKDVLLFPWVGEWSTDVFYLLKEDLKKHYA